MLRQLTSLFHAALEGAVGTGHLAHGDVFLGACYLALAIALGVELYLKSGERPPGPGDAGCAVRDTEDDDRATRR